MDLLGLAHGSVRVTDNRGLVSTRTATVTATEFTTGGGSPAETIANANLSYWSGPATATPGVGVYAPAKPTAAQAVRLSTSRTVFRQTLAVLGTSATWNRGRRGRHLP